MVIRLVPGFTGKTFLYNVVVVVSVAFKVAGMGEGRGSRDSESEKSD